MPGCFICEIWYNIQMKTKLKKEILKKVLVLAKRFYVRSKGEKKRADFDKKNYGTV